MTGEIVTLRTRREKKADELLHVTELMRQEMTYLEEVTAVVLRQAIEAEMPPSAVVAVRSACQLVRQATDVLVSTLDAAEGMAEKAEGPVG